MTTPLGSYSFLPWLRRGLANQIVSADGDPSIRLRPQVTVTLTATGEGVAGGTQSATVNRTVALYGPGDVVGVESRAIVRTEPRPGITNFEPNHVAHIEFYDEDFPWRYTPAAPDPVTGRLRPWVTLLVLAEDEFTEGTVAASRPLPTVDIPDLAVLPKASELWGWAHVHVNRSLAATGAEIVSSDTPAIGARLTAVLAENPDLACSRLLSPRRLAPDTAYQALLIPTFEAGRRAGLGLDLGAVAATASAWAPDDRPEPNTFPVYHRWSFRTGALGDFETLARLLRQRPVDPRVGQRALDVSHPGSGVRGLDAPLWLGGALRAPAASSPAEPDATGLRQDLERLVNLADDYQRAGDRDPIVTPPLYGRWHALTPRVPQEGWVRELNLDPPARVAAGLGTRVVRENQETYVQAAWDQVGAVLDAQRRIRQAQLALQVSRVWHEKYFVSTLDAPGRVWSLTAPLHARVMTDGLTLLRTQSASLLPPAMAGAATRRAMRPRGRLGEAFFTVPAQPGALIAAWPEPDVILGRANGGEVSAAPTRATPAAVLTADSAAGQLPVEAAAAVTTVSAQGRSLAWVASLPPVQGFTVGTLDRPGTPGRAGDADSVEAGRFKAALADTFVRYETAEGAGVRPVRPSLDLPRLATEAVDAVRPDLTIRRRLAATLALPGRMVAEIGDGLVEPMAYPVIDQPMYEPLVALGPDLFLPNVNLIETNTVTLLETNRRFIESYLVGVNHEFARELLWREYPTDQRGSTFRQFWDVRGDLATGDRPREAAYDIRPLHQWAPASELGDHRAVGSPADTLVLVIRGELLKRYPNTVVYAHRADAVVRAGGTSVFSRRPVPLAPGEENSPPWTKIRTPRYEARIDPDVFILGFDLTAAEARGAGNADDPGWFFIIKERPGDPRFGLDGEAAPSRQVWNDLSWADVLPTPPGPHLDLAAAPATIALSVPGAADATKIPQHAEDVAVAWSPTMNAAHLAYILLQVPVLVGIHASQMLPEMP